MLNVKSEFLPRDATARCGICYGNSVCRTRAMCQKWLKSSYLFTLQYSQSF